jgi:hypothetical protein
VRNIFFHSCGKQREAHKIEFDVRRLHLKQSLGITCYSESLLQSIALDARELPLSPPLNNPDTQLNHHVRKRDLYPTKSTLAPAIACCLAGASCQKILARFFSMQRST